MKISLSKPNLKQLTATILITLSYPFANMMIGSDIARFVFNEDAIPEWDHLLIVTDTPKNILLEALIILCALNTIAFFVLRLDQKSPNLKTTLIIAIIAAGLIFITTFLPKEMNEEFGGSGDAYSTTARISLNVRGEYVAKLVDPAAVITYVWALLALFKGINKTTLVSFALAALTTFTIIFFDLSSAQELGYIGVSTAICAIIVFILAKIFRKKEPDTCTKN